MAYDRCRLGKLRPVGRGPLDIVIDPLDEGVARPRTRLEIELCLVDVPEFAHAWDKLAVGQSIGAVAVEGRRISFGIGGKGRAVFLAGEDPAHAVPLERQG